MEKLIKQSAVFYSLLSTLILFPPVSSAGQEEDILKNLKHHVSLHMDRTALSENQTAVLDKSSDRDVPVILCFEDTSALFGQDYVISSDTITIRAGETSGTAELVLLDDGLAEAGEKFTAYICGTGKGQSDKNIGRISVSIADSARGE